MSLLEEALLLQRAAHDLMYLGMDGSPIYSDDLSRRNSEVYRLTTTLYNSGKLLLVPYTKDFGRITHF